MSRQSFLCQRPFLKEIEKTCNLVDTGFMGRRFVQHQVALFKQSLAAELTKQAMHVCSEMAFESLPASFHPLETCWEPRQRSADY